MLADFLRTNRKVCVLIRTLQCNRESAGLCAAPGALGPPLIVSPLHVRMKMAVMRDDDNDGLCDSYLSIDPRGSVGEICLQSVINLCLKLSKSMLCAPVILQKKFPLQLAPYVGEMMQFFYNVLTEEFPHCLQPMELTHSLWQQPDTVAVETQSQVQVSLVQQEMQREVLPLLYHVKTAVLFLSKVISCSAYEEFNAAEANGGSMHQQHLSGGSNSGGCCCTTSVLIGDLSEEAKDAVAAAPGWRVSFFNEARIAHFVRMLLYPLLSYTNKELIEWRNDPEQFYLSQQSLTEYESVKSAAEYFFIGLIDFAPKFVCDLLSPLMVNGVRQAAGICPLVVDSSSNELVLRLRCRELMIWDAVYLCAGLGIAQLTPYFANCSGEDCGGESSRCSANERSTLSVYGLPQHATPEYAAVIEKTQVATGACYWAHNYIGPLAKELLRTPGSGSLYPGGQPLMQARLVWLLSIWMHEFDEAVFPHVLTFVINIIGPAGAFFIRTC
jgi:hypothetical protein